MKELYLTRKEVPFELRNLFPEYKGNKWRLQITEKVTCSHGHWSGGSKSTWRILEPNGNVSQAKQFGSGFDGLPLSFELEIKPNMTVGEHRIFQGHDLGVTLYCHPSNVVKMLPTPVELTPIERTVLEITRSYISSARLEYAKREGISDAAWHETKRQLISKKLLMKNGAITVKGKNAVR